MEKLLKASQLLSNWLSNPCRFDLHEVADRGGILPEVCFLSRELKALLDKEHLTCPGHTESGSAGDRGEKYGGTQFFIGKDSVTADR